MSRHETKQCSINSSFSSLTVEVCCFTSYFPLLCLPLRHTLRFFTSLTKPLPYHIYLLKKVKHKIWVNLLHFFFFLLLRSVNETLTRKQIRKKSPENEILKALGTCCCRKFFVASEILVLVPARSRTEKEVERNFESKNAMTLITAHFWGAASSVLPLCCLSPVKSLYSAANWFALVGHSF